MRVFEAKNSSRRTLRKLRRALNSHPDAVLAIGSLPALLARQTVTDIPVVYTMVLDPEKEKLTYENMCGVAANGAYSEQLDILEQMAPTVRKIGTLFAPERLDGVVRQLRTEATEMGFQLEARPVHKPGELMMQLRSLKDSGVEALMLLLDPGLWTLDAFHKARAFAQEHEIIFIVPDGSMVRAGATFSFGPGFEELGAYAGRLATNLVEKKVTTAEIGMIYPSTRYFSVNPQDLDRFDLKMPASLYSQGAMTGAPRIILAPGKISD
jgi:putative ABC transport system substrate-binding protein